MSVDQVSKIPIVHILTWYLVVDGNLRGSPVAIHFHIEWLLAWGELDDRRRPGDRRKETTLRGKHKDNVGHSGESI